MGNFVDDNKDIARIKEGQQVSLSAVPNYIQFESKKEEDDDIDIKGIDITVVSNALTLTDKDNSKVMLIITDEKTKTEHRFHGTDKEQYVDANTFMVNKESLQITTENLKTCLMKNSFMFSNFELSILFSGTPLKGSNVINIRPLGRGANYNFKVWTNAAFLATSSGILSTENKDSIDNGKNNTVIELDVYTNTSVALGQKFEPENPRHQGSYLTTIQKAYFRRPLWFNLNATFGNSTAYSTDFLKNEGWCDAGTCKDFRFAAYRNDKVNKVPFYISDVFYVINGYGRNLDKHNLEKYIYSFAEEKTPITPLTKQLTRTHIEGQTQYFNFIAAKTDSKQHPLALIYKLYTQSGVLIDSTTQDQLDYDNLKIVNTIKLDIDNIISNYPTAGILKVCLAANDTQQSEDITFHILPPCLHAAKDFAFLNPLGGWDSFGFADNQETEFSASPNTIFKTQTPDFTVSSQIESVYNKEVKELFTVRSMPITPQTAEWLKDMSASPAVYELATKRYIIVEDMKLKYNTGDDLVRVEMKYRYSDSYNGQI